MFSTTTAMADDYSNHPVLHYMQVADGQSMGRQTNPWLLPERQHYRQDFQYYPDYQNQRHQQDRQAGSQENRQDYQQYPDYQRQHEQDSQFGNQSQVFRFVTPEDLESLKRQQTQTQMMQDKQQSHRYGQQSYGAGYYNYPTYGLGYGYPLYNAPAVSPWGSSPDLLYRGNSFPWVPDAAIGGLPPIHVSPLRETDEEEKLPEYNVFDPFSLLPNAN